MAQFNINGRECEIDGAKNLLHACLKAGVEVPHYCWHPGLSVVASCRLCLVEAGTTDPKDPSKVAWQPKLVPACQTPVAAPRPPKEGEPPPAPVVNFIKTDTDKVKSNQQHVMEYLLINHPLDCPVCDQAGECLLQDFSYKYGPPRTRFVENKEKQAKKDLGPTIVLFADRCILCSRCVRFDAEVAGTERLGIVNRGNHCEIDVFPGLPLDHKLSGNVGDLCPVGALEDKDFLYKQRVWFLKDHPSVCGGCSTGCSTWVDANPTTNVMWRMRPRTNPAVNEYWMCDDGRYGWKYVNSSSRLTAPVVRKVPAGVSAELAAKLLPKSDAKAETKGEARTGTTATGATAVGAAAHATAHAGNGNGHHGGSGAGTTAALMERDEAAVDPNMALARAVAQAAPGVPLPMYQSSSGTGSPGLAPAERSRWERYKYEAGRAKADWTSVLAAVRESFRAAVIRHGASSVAAVVSPFASCEEAWLLAKFLRGSSSGADAVSIALGPVPVVGTETKFKAGFTIRAEKAPNRRGVELVLAGAGGARPLDALRADLRERKIKALFVLGGYPDAGTLAADGLAEDFRKAETLVVVDILAGKLADSADIVLPGAAAPERTGTWVNHAGIAQTFHWAIHPSADARRDGQILAELAGRTGLYNAEDVLAEIAAAVPAFAPAKGGKLPADGVKLAV